MVGVSSGVGRTECWHEYKILRKQYINLNSTPIDRYDQRPPGKRFNFPFLSPVPLTTYDKFGVSSCVGRTECWPEYKNLWKQCFNAY